MYVRPNFKTKKALKDAIKKGQKVTVFQPNDIFGTPIPENGEVAVEGPHYPEPHKWYATATIQNGVVTKVK
jgi:hypothetical protein